MDLMTIVGVASLVIFVGGNTWINIKAQMDSEDRCMRAIEKVDARLDDLSKCIHRDVNDQGTAYNKLSNKLMSVSDELTAMKQLVKTVAQEIKNKRETK